MARAKSAGGDGVAPAGTVTFEQVRSDPEVQAFIKKADENLGQLGYTEHGTRHAHLVSSIAENILLRLGRPKREAELAAIAGYLHDMGNGISRLDHGIAAALLAQSVLRRRGMPVEEYVEVMCAIGNHEEEYGEAVSTISAALILGDKSDVHKSRVRVLDPAAFDMHDRVNFASKKSFVNVDAEAKTITLELEIDTSSSSVMEYFEIFLSRMVMCRRAAEFLGCRFSLVINKTILM
jgi:metal-dependent HD superfamily phosphatase/phosphodiesterase